MRQLTMEQRLKNIEDNLAIIKQMLEKVLNSNQATVAIEDDCEIMTVNQVAKFLNLDPNVIYQKCGKGDMPYFRIGKGYRFKKNEILKWVENQKELPEISVDDYVERYLQKNRLKA